MNYLVPIRIISWIYNFLTNINFNIDLQSEDEKLHSEGELDKRWIFQNDQWMFNFDYPIYQNDHFLTSEKTHYNFHELMDAFRNCNLEFNFNTDFQASQGQVQQPILIKIPKLPSRPHVVQDFDQILLYYRQLRYEARVAEEFERIYEQRTENEQVAENNTLRRLVRAYLEAPLLRDQHYQAINNLVFGEVNDDPLSLYEFTGDTNLSDSIKSQMKSNLEDKIPKLRCLSKKTLSDREYRRHMLLSSKIKNFIESERVIGVLNEIRTPNPQNNK